MNRAAPPSTLDGPGTAMFRLTPSGSTFGERVLRSMGLILLLAGISYLYWNNYERSMQRIGMRQAVMDRTGQLSAERMEEVWEFSNRMRERFGITVEVRIAQRELLAPDQGPRTLYIGLVPSERRSMIVFPPLVERALGREFITYLREEHFRMYWDSEQGWQEGLRQAMILIWDQLRQMERADG
jgi:hypothetical protein